MSFSEIYFSFTACVKCHRLIVVLSCLFNQRYLNLIRYMYLRVLHIPEKGSAYKQILLNYLDIWIIHMFDLIWPKNIKFFWGGGGRQLFKISLLFMKIKVPALFKLGICGLVDLYVSLTHTATEILVDNKCLR